MTAVTWNEEHWSYFVYNLTSGERHVYSLADKDALPSELERAPEGRRIHPHAGPTLPLLDRSGSKLPQREPVCHRSSL